MKKLSPRRTSPRARALFAPAPTTTPATPPTRTPTNAALSASTVADSSCPTLGQRTLALSSLEGKHGTVIIFVSTNCPVRTPQPAHGKTRAGLEGKGVNVVGINSNAPRPRTPSPRTPKRTILTFAILKDRNNKIADALGARVTPEAYFLDASNKLVYRGRVDDKDPRRGDATVSELRDAVEATVSGKPVAKAEALAFGCSIKRG